MSQFTPALALSSLLFSAGVETQKNLFLTTEHNLSLKQAFKKAFLSKRKKHLAQKITIRLMPVEALDIHINYLGSFSTCSMDFLHAWKKNTYRPE